MNFNEKLKLLRRSSRLTQQQVASFIGVKRVAYTAYEAGRTSPSLENVVKLAKLYNTTTDSLLGCYTNAGLVINEKEREYGENDDRFSENSITDEERELIALFRVSDKKESIISYAKKTLK